MEQTYTFTIQPSMLKPSGCGRLVAAPTKAQNVFHFAIQRAARKPWGCGRFSSPLRKAVSIHRGCTPQNANKKIPVPKEILGTRTEWIFCGTTLFAAGAATSCRRQHVRCLITPALRQKILSECCSPCPRRPICRLAYRPALSYAGLSVGATPALLPPHRFRI